ncbi:MAG: beta-alanine-activating enzyme beta-propeller domain-containing protein [Planctomycetota bacterium]
MRNTVIEGVAVGVLVAGGIILALMMVAGESDEVQLVPKAQQTQATVWKSRDWPMFHGGQGLLGRAPGTLSDSLELVWKFETSDQIKSSPVIVDDIVYVGSSDANMYAIDFETGSKVWEYQTPDAIEATPCVIAGSVYVGCSDGWLYALDAKTGSFRWKYETDGEILGAANWTRSADGAGVWIIVGSYDNRLHCVDSATGKAVWTYETDNYINGSPAITDNKTVFGGCDAIIHVVSLTDGTKAAGIDGGSYIAGSAAFIDGQVYIGNYDNVFVRADIATEKIVWEYAESDSPFFSSPAIGEDVVVFGGRDSKVHCIGRDDGKVVWTFQTLGEVDSSPAICADKVVIGSEDGRLYMLKLSDGTKIWSYETGQPITSSPAVVGGKVVVGCDNGYVYAFGPKR